MTVSAADVVAPVFAAAEVITFLFARMAGKTRLRNFLRRLVLERNDLRRVALFHMRLARPMTRFAACYFVFPTVDTREASVGSMREDFELILVTVFAGVATDVIIVGRRSARTIGP